MIWSCTLNPKPSLKNVYVAGPMQGIPKFNFPRFNAITKVLRLEGHNVFNPAEKDIERHGGTDITNPAGDIAQAKSVHGFSLREALAHDCEYICLEANCILMLPGWENSKGAMAEHRLATALQSEGMDILYINEEECQAMEEWVAKNPDFPKNAEVLSDAAE